MIRGMLRDIKPVKICAKFPKGVRKIISEAKKREIF